MPPSWDLKVHILSGPEEAVALAKLSVKNRAYAVLVAGGDGTINAVAGVLLRSDCRLGVIPCGTGNGFARGLGLSMDPDRACESLSRGKEIRVDVGLVGKDRVFVNVCGTGLDAWAARRSDSLRWLGALSGLLRYLVAALHGWVAFKPSRLRVEADAFKFDGLLLDVVVANSEQYGLDTIVAPGARVNDGYFDVVLVPKLPAFQIAKNLWNLIRKKRMADAIYLRAKKITIDADPLDDVPFHLDGESAGSAPLSIRMAPRSLKVLVP